MSLRSAIEFARRLEKELVLVNTEPDDPVVDRLRAHFDTQNVAISTVRTATGAPSEIGILSDRREVLATVDVSVLRELTDLASPRRSGVGVSDGEYEEILGHLKETTFTSYDTEQLFYASREIEDRARRVGHGTIHAGFQRFSHMADQRVVYRDLAQRDVEVHAYGVPDVTPPDFGTGVIHPVDNDEIAQSWFVVFDGGGEDARKCALIAEERQSDGFYGVWTYDPELVDRVREYLEREYVDQSGVTATQTRD